MAVELNRIRTPASLPEDENLNSKDAVLQELYADHRTDSFEELKQRLEARGRYDSAFVSKHRPQKSREKMCLFCYARITVGNDGKEFGHRRRLNKEIHGFEWDDCPFACSREGGWE